MLYIILNIYYAGDGLNVRNINLLVNDDQRSCNCLKLEIRVLCVEFSKLALGEPPIR